MAIKNIVNAWKIVAKNNLQSQLLTFSSSSLFMLGKLLNFIFTIVIIYAIFTATSSVGGYSLRQAVVVVLVYNLIESITQFLFRSVYTFRPIIVKGDFDLDLLKPLPSFFRPLLSGPDFLDFPLILIQLFALVFFYLNLGFHLSPLVILSFIVFTIISIVISFSTLLFIAGFCILTSEIDNLIWIYRSFMRAGVVPTDIYAGGFSFLLNYIIPVTIIVTIPAKSLLGLLDLSTALFALFFTAIYSYLSWNFWKYSLRHYTSASS